MDSHSEGSSSSEASKELHQQDTQAGQALEKVMADLETAGKPASLLPALKRRNSGNLRRPWTTVEEALLIRLVEQADYRKVLNTSRLSKLWVGQNCSSPGPFWILGCVWNQANVSHPQRAT
ncbi:hypothetical protein WJX77_002455 [Trebouxia sp. C0004]